MYKRRRERIRDIKREKPINLKPFIMGATTLTVMPITAQAVSPVQQKFVDEIGPIAQELAGANDLYASVMIAQAILESNYGQSGLSSAPNYNLFGIKGRYNGSSVTMKTWEDNGKGQLYQIDAPFRRYPSYRESLQDYVNLLTSGISGSRYFYSGAWKSHTNSYKDATLYLTGRYATATNYNTSLNQLIEQFNLTQYDKPSRQPQPVTTPVENTTTSTNNGNQIYTVILGDYLYKIAMEHGVSVRNLQEWNNLTTNILYVGQKLRVTPPSQRTEETYIVQPGDGLWIISQRTGVSIENLMKYNQLTSYLIHPNQVLRLSNNEQVSHQSQPQQSSTHYIVQPGDSLWKIGQEFDISVSELKALNNLTSDLIHPNQKLRVQ